MLDGEGRELKIFGFVVDGELGWIHSSDQSLEQWVAVMRSNPTVVELTDEQFTELTAPGVDPYTYTYDGENFNPPAQ